MADKVFNLLSSMMHWWAGQTDDFIPPIVKALRRDKRKLKGARPRAR